MVVEQLDNHIQKNEIGSLDYTTDKQNNFKCIEDFNR